MPAMGHSRRFDRLTATSGLPRTTDIFRISRVCLKGANRRHRACTPLDSFLSEDLKVNTTFLVGERYGRLSSRHSTVDMRRLL